MVGRSSRSTAAEKAPAGTTAARKTNLADPSGKTKVMAGRTGDPRGRFVGYDGERRRFAGQVFYWYGAKLPSWVRVQDAAGEWIDVAVAEGKRQKATAEVRRAHPATPPGQAPTKRLRRLEDDERALEAELKGKPVADPDGESSAGASLGFDGDESGADDRLKDDDDASEGDE